jgi:hypothetical protein
MADVDITEFEELGAEKVSGVGSPANGTSWLLMKAAAPGEPPQASAVSPHTSSGEADAFEDEVTKDEASEIEALLTKSGIWSSYCGVEGCGVCEEDLQKTFAPEVLEKARLKAKQRAALPSSAFAVPEKAPGPGSYPVTDRRHAVQALRLKGHASPKDQKRIEAKVHSKFPDVGKDSPGVPNGDAQPREKGHMDTGMSGLAGNMTGRPDNSAYGTGEQKTDWPGGKNPYAIPVEAKANSIGPHGGPHMRKDSWEIEIDLAEKQNWMSLDGATGAPGSSGWEDYDANTLDSVARGLAAASRAVDEIAKREQVEALSGDSADWFDAWKLNNAAEDICSALGLVATLAYHEAAEGQAAKNIPDSFAADILRVMQARQNADTGNRTSEEGSLMALTVTKEELDAFIGETAKKAVDDRFKKFQKTNDKKMKKTTAEILDAIKDGAAKNSPGVPNGDVSDVKSIEHGHHDAEDVDAIEGAHGTKPAITKEVKVKKGKKGGLQKAVLTAIQTNNELLAKQLARPRTGGPVVDGMPRPGLTPAVEGRQIETAAKDTVVTGLDADITRLEKELSEATDPGMRENKSRELTLAKLKLGHVTGAVPVGGFGQ